MGVVRFDQIARECRETFKGSFEGKPIVGLEHIEPYDMLLKNYDVDVETTFTKSFRKGQILFGRRRAYQHKACVATIDGICSGDITVIEPIEGAICPDLLPFIIQNDDFFEHAIKGSNGALSPRVKWEHMANYEINLPSLPEQKVLAEKLWAAYDVKQSYLKMIDATQDMVKAQFIEKFNNVNHSKSLCEICRPKQWPTIQTKDFTDNGYLVYGANGIIGHYTEYNHEHPTILVACRGASCGAINVSEPKSYITGNAMCLDDLTDEVCFDYLVHFLSYYDYKAIITGGAQPQITFTSLQKVNVPIPSIELQQKFVTFAQQADKSISELRKSIDAIDKVIKSLINENL